MLFAVVVVGAGGWVGSVRGGVAAGAVGAVGVAPGAGAGGLEEERSFIIFMGRQRLDGLDLRVKMEGKDKKVRAGFGSLGFDPTRRAGHWGCGGGCCRCW